MALLGLRPHKVGTNKFWDSKMTKNKSDRLNFVRLVAAGKSVEEIMSISGIPRSTLFRWKAKLIREGHLEAKPHSGRPSLMSPRALRHLSRISKKNSRRSATFIARAAGFDVDVKTARKYLKECGVFSFKMIRRQFLTRRHAKLRLKWACEHLGFSGDQWRKWVFSDECSVEMMCGEAGQRVWIKPDDRLKPWNVKMIKQKGGGSVMVWAAISVLGCGPLVFVEGKMNKIKYLEIMKNTIDQYLNNLT